MAIYDEILAGLNADKAKVNALNPTDYEKAAKESLAAEKQAEQNTINTGYDSVKTNTQAVFDKNLADAKTAYESEYQKNAVQKLINEKKIAETNANLGLTDSGLNRTQQTAAQLSYANQKEKIDLARQSALDNLTLELSAALTDIENNRNSDLLASNQKWDSEARSIAQTNYNNDLTAYNNRITSAYEQLSAIDKARIEADADVQKAAISASTKEASSQNNNKIYKINYGELANTTYSSNGNVKYSDINGNTVEMRAGTNPFTNSINRDVLDEFGEYDTSKVFSNGYQPNNYKGSELKAFKSKDKNISSTFDAYWRTDGLPQTIWESTNGKKYVWVGPNNCYEEVEYNKSIKDWVFV